MTPSSLSVTQLGQLNEAVFSECGTALGGADGYSNDQLITLGKRIAQVRLSIFAVIETESSFSCVIYSYINNSSI